MKRIPHILCIVGIIASIVLLQWMIYENEHMAPLVIMLGLILAISAIICHVKRCHDIGKSGWFVLWLLVPIANLFVFLYLIFTPSAPSSKPSSSGSAEVDQKTCIGCGVCMDACPAEAIDMVDGRAAVDPEKCVECGVCWDECPLGCISPKTYGSKVEALIEVTSETSEEYQIMQNSQKASVNDTNKADSPSQKQSHNTTQKSLNGTLCNAAKVGRVDEVRELLCKGADVNTTRNGVSPLLYATGKGHLDIVNILLKNGASPNFQNKYGVTPLYLASQYGYDKIVQLLLEAGAKIDTCTFEGSTPLFIASQQGHIIVVKYLLEKNADINATLTDGQTPLYVASFYGHENVVKLLLERKANVNAANNNGATPLFVATQQGFSKVVKLLLDAKAEVNVALKSDGVTPLFRALEESNIDIAELLVRAGADINVKVNVRGKSETPFSLAKEKGLTQIIDLLQEYSSVTSLKENQTNNMKSHVLDNRESQDEKSNTETKACPNCGFSYAYDGVICKHCGTSKSKHYVASKTKTNLLDKLKKPFFDSSKVEKSKLIEKLVVKLNEAERYGERTGWPAVHLYPQSLEIRRIGKLLYDSYGYEGMLHACNTINSINSRQASLLNHFWSGVGSWIA